MVVKRKVKIMIKNVGDDDNINENSEGVRMTMIMNCRLFFNMTKMLMTMVMIKMRTTTIINAIA